MESQAIEARTRSVLGKQVGAIRREGRLPAVMYGKGIEPISLELDTKEVSKVLTHSGGATLINLNVGEESHTVLIREVQRHPVSRELLHIDFLKVAMDVAIRTAVPIELVGEAPAVKELGGVLVTGLSEIEVEALPSDLPDRVTIDLEALKKIDDSLTVGDLFLGRRVEILEDAEDMIVKVIYQAEEAEEEEEVVVEEEEEPEIIEKGRREEEEGAEPGEE